MACLLCSTEPEWRRMASLEKKECGQAFSSVFVQLLAHASTAPGEQEHQQAAKQH